MVKLILKLDILGFLTAYGKPISGFLTLYDLKLTAKKCPEVYGMEDVRWIGGRAQCSGVIEEMKLRDKRRESKKREKKKRPL